MIGLDALFKPLTALINKRIREQTRARELAESLDGHSMAVRIRDTALAIYLVVEEETLLLRTSYEQDPDVVLTGSPISLASLAGSDPQAVIRDGHVTISGDASLGQKFQQLILLAQPDVEDELANVVGDVAAERAASLARGAKNIAVTLGDRAKARFGEYLTRDREALPSRELFEQFRSDLEKLRDDVARTEARVKILTRRAEEAD